MAWIPDPSRALVIIKRLETGKCLLENAIELFSAFFTETHSPEQFPKRMEVIRANKTGHYVDPEIASAMELAMSCPDAGVQLVIKRLDGLADMFNVAYQPDEPEDAVKLLAAIHYQATLLVRAMRLSSNSAQEFGYGDDVASLHGELEGLLLRCGDLDPELLRSMRSYSERLGYSAFWGQPMAPLMKGASLHTIRSISERVGTELAFQRGDYAEALRCIVASLEAFTQAKQLDDPSPAITLAQDDSDEFPPWLAKAEDLAKDYMEHLRFNPSKKVDWMSIMSTCKALKENFVDEDDKQDYWGMMIGWAQAQLSPDQLLSLYKDRTHEAAAMRLSRYFFSSGMWELLSKQGRELLITADSTWMSDGDESRLRTILNPLQRATENILYYHLWTPLPETLKVKVKNQYPGLTEYISLLSRRATKDYFRELGITTGDRSFLTRACRHLRHLRDVRNKVEHEPDSSVETDEIRKLYADFLGIGCRGVLPELVRILAKH